MSEIAGRHQTIPKELKLPISRLLSHVSVEKIIIGITDNCRHRYTPGTLLYKKDVPGGIYLNGYSGRGVTRFFIKVYPEFKEQLLEDLQNF